MPGKPGQIPRTAISLLAAVAIAALAIVGFGANEARREYDRQLEEADQRLAAASLALSAQVERDVQSLRLVMGYARRLAANYDLSRPEVGAELHPALHNLALGMPLIGNLLLIDSQGVVAASSLVASQPPIAVGDRAYFQFHAGDPSLDLRIGENNQSRTLGMRVVQFTQRIDRPDGSFGGVVLVALRHEYFASLFQSLVAPAGGAAALLRRDGRLLARYPAPDEAAFERSYAASPLFAQLATAPAGSFRSESSLIDGEDRYNAYRAVGDFPLLVNVSQHREDILAPWRARAWRHLAVAVLAIAVMVALSGIVLSQLLRRERQTRALAASEARFRSLFDSAADSVFLIRDDSMVVSANVEASRALDLPASAIEGHFLCEFLTEPDATALAHALAMIGSAPGQGLEGSLRGKNGVSLPVEVRFSRVGWAGENLYLGLARDISERKAYQAQLERLASYDELTQVPKRGLFMDRLAQALALAQRKGRQVGVLFVDLDRFKEINDTLGHACGDEILQRAAQRMLASLRQVDTVGRYGGDEFVVLLPEITQLEDIETVANKLCDVFQEPFDLKGRDVVVGASIGVAVFPRDGDSAEALVRRADEAMYAAKLAGRSRVRLYAGN